MWLAVIAILVYLELLQTGLFFLVKNSGEKNPYTAFIPVYGLKYLTAVAGKIKILSVPVTRPFGFFAELLAISLLCALYWNWGLNNLTVKAYTWLGEIMILPIIICLALCYIAIVKSAFKVCEDYTGAKRVLLSVLSLLVLPVPFIFAAKGLAK